MNDREQYDRDLEALERSWNAFVHDMYDGSNSHLHPPPALVEAVQRCWVALAKRTEDGEPGTVDYEEVTPGTVVQFPAGWITMYGAVMFEYGQRSISFGGLIGNMTQCHCHDVDDSELEDLLKEGKGKDK
jgi:hypothetical protein